MNQPGCQHLDDYLNQALPAEERTWFAVHLENCPSCRRSVQEQEHCDRLLRQAVVQLQPIPEGLAARARVRIQRTARARHFRRAAGLAASLLLAGVCVWWFQRQPAEQGPDARARVERALPADPVRPDPRPLVEVNFGADVPVIVVPVKTQRPNVTILWVYPAIQTVDRGQPKVQGSNTLPEREGL